MLPFKTLRLLAVGRHLFLERGKLGERRIGIRRTIALTRRGARGILPVRRPTFPAAAVAIASTPALVAPLVPSAFTPRIVAIAELRSVVAVLASLAVEAIARLVVPPLLARGRAGSGCGNGAIGRRLIGARLVEITVTVAPAMPVTLTSGALGFFP